MKKKMMKKKKEKDKDKEQKEKEKKKKKKNKKKKNKKQQQQQHQNRSRWRSRRGAGGKHTRRQDESSAACPMMYTRAVARGTGREPQRLAGAPGTRRPGGAPRAGADAVAAGRRGRARAAVGV